MSSVRLGVRGSGDDVIVIDSDDDNDLVRQGRLLAACLVFKVVVPPHVPMRLQVSTSGRQTAGALPKAGVQRQRYGESSVHNPCSCSLRLARFTLQYRPQEEQICDNTACQTA